MATTGLLSLTNVSVETLTQSEQNVATILQNLSEDELNQLKVFLKLGDPGVIGPATIDQTLQALTAKGLDLTDGGVTLFKDRELPGGNTGNLRGVIGPQTAQIYLHLLLAPQGLQFSTTRPAGDLQSHLNEIQLRGYADMINRGAAKFDFPPAVVAGVGSRESFWGLILDPPGPAGTGDLHHAYGLMQIDGRSFPAFTGGNDWKDPDQNISFGCRVLSGKRAELQAQTNATGRQLLQLTVASYNGGVRGVLDALDQGLGPDNATANRDYSKDVFDRAGWFQKYGGFS